MDDDTKAWVTAETDTELKSDILNLETAREYKFFNKDMVLGNIDDKDTQFINICYDIISDLKLFSSGITSRQFLVYMQRYRKNKEFKSRVDEEIETYNKMVDNVRKELKDLISKETEEATKKELTAQLELMKNIDVNDYFITLSTEEGTNNFFDLANEKFKIAIFARLNLSRSKGGFQQKELLRKRLEQTYAEKLKGKGLLARKEG